MLFIFGRGEFIKEAHGWTIRDKGNNPIGFIFENFQSTDPEKHNNQANPGNSNSELISRRHLFHHTYE